jgi:acyl carrier protein
MVGEAMGLDGVELVMNVEETFGVVIPDKLAGKMRTVGQLYEFLLAHCTNDRTSTCLTSTAFYRVRQGICNVMNVDRRAVRPSTQLDALFARSGYRRFWVDFRRAMFTFRLPNLGRPACAWQLIEHPIGFAILAALATFIVFVLAPAQTGSVIIPLVGLEFVVAAVFMVMAEPIARLLPRDFQTVGDLSRIVLMKNHAWFVARQKTWDEGQIWDVLRATVSKTLGVELTAVTPQARFVEDLGVG